MNKSTIFLLIALSITILVSSSIAFASEMPPTLNIDLSKLKKTTELETTPPSLEFSFETPPSLNISLETLEKYSKELPPSIDLTKVTEVAPSLTIALTKKIKRVPIVKITRIPTTLSVAR